MNNGSEPRPINAVKLRLIDGTVREFLLSMGGLRRLKQRFNSKTLEELLQRDAEEVGVPLLWEALRDKSEMTEEQLYDLLPGHLDAMADAISELILASFPEIKAERESRKRRPSAASPESQPSGTG